MAIDLSVLDRIKPLLPIKLTTTTHDAILRQIITGVSGSVERFLNRKLQRTTWTRTFDVKEGQRRFQLDAYPIVSITSVKSDYSRLFTGDAIDSTLYSFNARDDAEADGLLELDKYLAVEGPGMLQSVWVGGMGHAGVRFAAAASGGAGTFTADETVTGGTSGAKGLIRATLPGATMSIDVLSGVFVEGETITGASSAATKVIGATSSKPICFEFPDVIQAAEWQMCYLWKRRNTQGALNLSADGSSISMETPTFDLSPGVKSALARHRSMVA